MKVSNIVVDYKDKAFKEITQLRNLVFCDEQGEKKQYIRTILG